MIERLFKAHAYRSVAIPCSGSASPDHSPNSHPRRTPTMGGRRRTRRIVPQLTSSGLQVQASAPLTTPLLPLAAGGGAQADLADDTQRRDGAPLTLTRTLP
eukprot:scaffold25349_cov40-Phaeocystis_antarctica.AAC.3